MKENPILRKIFHRKPSKGAESQPNTKKLWMRLGVTLSISAEEETAIFCGDDKTSEDALRKIIAKGRFVPDGDSYVPGPAIENFNRYYGTDHVSEDLNIDY